MEIGTTLDNGAIVIASDTNGRDEYVLAMWKRGQVTSVKYITWLIGDKGDIIFGHYSKDIFSAVADFKERIKVN